MILFQWPEGYHHYYRLLYHHEQQVVEVHQPSCTDFPLALHHVVRKLPSVLPLDHSSCWYCELYPLYHHGYTSYWSWQYNVFWIRNICWRYYPEMNVCHNTRRCQLPSPSQVHQCCVAGIQLSEVLWLPYEWWYCWGGRICQVILLDVFLATGTGCFLVPEIARYTRDGGVYRWHCTTIFEEREKLRDQRVVAYSHLLGMLKCCSFF